MQVILLAAGVSSRLDPIEDKNLLEFLGKPLLEHRIASLKKAKLRDIVVVGNKENMDQLKAVAKKFNNVAVTEQKDMKEGSAGAILAASALVKHKNILILSTNDILDEEVFEKMIEESKGEVDGLIAAKKMNKYFPGGYLAVDKKGFMTDIVEKPGEGKQPSDIVNIVLHIYNDFPAFLKHLKKATGKADDRYENALKSYIKKDGAKMGVYRYHGEWQAIKYPWHILQAMNYYLRRMQPKIEKSAEVAKSAIIRGDVYIGARVKIHEGAVIQGPAYIGEGSVIGNNAMVRESMLGHSCVIGFGSEVTRSYLDFGVWTHSTYLGDSVVDHNVSFGAGSVIGNLRFDEGPIKMTIKGEKVDSGLNKLGVAIGAGSRFGINSCTNPGIKVGVNCFIGGNVLVDKDIPDNKMVLLEQKLKVMDNKKTADTSAREAGKKKKGK